MHEPEHVVSGGGEGDGGGGEGGEADGGEGPDAVKSTGNHCGGRVLGFDGAVEAATKRGNDQSGMFICAVIWA